MITHDLNKMPNGRWSVTPNDTVVFAVGKPTAAERSQAAAGNLADAPLVRASKHVRVVHRLSYNEAQHIIDSGLPGIHLVKPVRLTKGSLVRLA